MRVYMLIFLMVMFGSPAMAATLKKDDTAQVDVGGFGRVRLLGQRTGSSSSTDIAMVMARLRGQVKYKSLGRMKLELESARQAGVLDLFVEVGQDTGLRAGRFKVPLSRELLMSIASLPIYDRTLITRQLGLRRRTGMMLYHKRTLGAFKLIGNLGAFDAQTSPTLPDDRMLLIGSVDAISPIGLELHMAYMHRVLDAGPRWVLPEGTLDFDRWFDAALYFEHRGLRILAEGLLAHESRWFYGAHGLLAYRWLEHYELAGSVDWIEREARQTRWTANAHWLLRGRLLQVSFGYALITQSNQVNNHLGLLELQGGF